MYKLVPPVQILTILLLSCYYYAELGLLAILVGLGGGAVVGIVWYVAEQITRERKTREMGE